MSRRLWAVAQLRVPTESERRLLAHLAKAGGMSTEWLDTVLVSEMNDGGMGSLRLAPNGIDRPERRFGNEVAEFKFDDADGMGVSATLNIDQDGAPFELDVWKYDFRPLIQMPQFD